MFVKKEFYVKTEYHGKGLIYVLFHFIKTMKQYIESQTPHVKTAEYKHGNSIISIYDTFNPFKSSVTFLYPLKMSEILWFF